MASSSSAGDQSLTGAASVSNRSELVKSASRPPRDYEETIDHNSSGHLHQLAAEATAATAASRVSCKSDTRGLRVSQQQATDRASNEEEKEWRSSDHQHHHQASANQLSGSLDSSGGSGATEFIVSDRSKRQVLQENTNAQPTQTNDNHHDNAPNPANTESNQEADACCQEVVDIRAAAGDSSSLYWRLLSNLPTSITQRGKLSAAELAPEVAGYLERLKCNSSSSSSTTNHNNSSNNNNNNNNTTMSKPAAMDTRPPPYEAGEQQQQHEMILMNTSYTTSTAPGAATTESNSRVIRIVAPATTTQDQQQQQSSSSRTNTTDAIKPTHGPNQHQKLSIASTVGTTATGRSSATSLSSCMLSESSTSSKLRLKWGKKMDFLLSIIGFAVDLANIWRFPYLVYKNGGGVFLIPYLIMLIFGGIPLFFLELCLGQFVKKGPITVWNKICPAMKGVGYCSIMISWYVSFYYNVLIAWSVYFIYRSLNSIGYKMPWEDCDNSWNSNGTCVSISRLKEMCSLQPETTLEMCRKQLFNTVNVTSPASDFFVRELSQIDKSTGLNDMGKLRYELVFCTSIVYLLHYFSLFRGLETSGKVVWVTATAPYVILSILLVRGLFLPGAAMGIEYYLSPRLEKLADPQVWIDAAQQVFYSIGVGFGVHLTYASFNSHNNNCYRDCLMTSAVNILTSVYSGLVVFIYLGYMAQNLGIEIDKVASESYSLVFEVYPEALTTLPFARFWSILFFIMLLTLGIDSAMGGLEAVITGLEDEFKFARRLSRGQLTALVIISSFLPALISCTQGGAYTLFWFDIYSAGVSLLFAALFETIGVVYCYGLDKFILNIESMLGRKPPLFYILCWKYISPLFLGGVIFMSIYTAGVPTYRGYTFPVWSIILGWCLAFSSVAAIPIVAIYYYCNRWLFGSALDKSGRRRDRGSSSVASSRHGGGGSKKSPSHRSVSVSCGLQAQGGLTNTTTSVLTASPVNAMDGKSNSDKYPDCIEDML